MVASGGKGGWAGGWGANPSCLALIIVRCCCSGCGWLLLCVLHSHVYVQGGDVIKSFST